MIILVDIFALAARFGDAQSHMAEQGEAEQTEAEKASSSQLGEADHIALEPEADPFKRILNKIKHLVSTGIEDNLIHAYELARTVLDSGRFNYDESHVAALTEQYLEIRDLISQHPNLKAVLDHVYPKALNVEDKSDAIAGAIKPEQDEQPSSNNLGVEHDAYPEPIPFPKIPGHHRRAG